MKVARQNEPQQVSEGVEGLMEMLETKYEILHVYDPVPVCSLHTIVERVPDPLNLHMKILYCNCKM